MTARNLVVILSDEHQARAMGCAGHPFVKTPNLDALAARGTRFTNCVTPSPICVPARAAFATGKYPHQIGLWDNAMPYVGDPESWGHVLQRAGVPCTSIGKLHYREASDDVGFDEQIAPMHVVGGMGMVWASIRSEEDRITPQSRMLGDYIGPGDSKYTDYDKAVTQKACDWLRAQKADAGFCLYVGLVAPHFPLVVPQEFYDLYANQDLGPVKLHPDDGYRRHPWVDRQNANMNSEALFASDAERHAARVAYYGLCSWLDHNVGQILDALDAAGLADNTTVIYSSDHGDNVGARGLWGKSNFYQESVSVPLIVAEPGQSAATCDTPASLIDVSATITDHFNQGETFGEGTSLYSLATKDDPDRVQFSEYHAAGAVSGGFMIRKGRWKLNHYMGFRSELFDLENDPEELSDLATDPAYRETIAWMEAALREICDPVSVSAQAFADQAALIASYGGREAALKLGAPGATPPPEV
ncbi:MAG: sulfatase-like hydrolase/transferase [Pseudomonadota bacterium]